MHHQILEMAIYGRGDFMLKKKINGAWDYLSFVKKKVSGSWADCDTLKKYFNGAWSTIWQRWPAGFSAYPGRPSSVSYSYLATTTAGGNMLMKLYNRQSNDGEELKVTTYNGTSRAFYINAGETIFVDYIYTQSGNCYESYIMITDFQGRIYEYLLSPTTSNSSGTVSYTPTSGFSGYLIFKVHNSDVYTSSTNYGQLEVSKIYTDSKIFYWGTETLINQ